MNGITKTRRRRRIEGLGTVRLAVAAALGLAVTVSAGGAAAAVVFDYSGQIQTWTAPVSGLYDIGARGADGGNIRVYYPPYYNFFGPGGAGAFVSGEVTLTKGETLSILVGGRGQDGFTNFYTTIGGGGGGGSFVALTSDSTPLVVAGGGGGTNDPFGIWPGGSGQGITGAPPNGGATTDFSWLHSGGAGGGGFAGDGQSQPGADSNLCAETGASHGAPGASFLNGGGGGSGNFGDGHGGFGGGGGGGCASFYALPGGGGGGGYAGGGGGYVGTGAIGGTSFLGQGVAQTSDAALPGPGGNGEIEIMLLKSTVPEPATWAMLLLGAGMIGGALRRRGAARRGLTEA